jgi:hypothetical protein
LRKIEPASSERAPNKGPNEFSAGFVIFHVGIVENVSYAFSYVDYVLKLYVGLKFFGKFKADKLITHSNKPPPPSPNFDGTILGNGTSGDIDSLLPQPPDLS